MKDTTHKKSKHLKVIAIYGPHRLHHVLLQSAYRILVPISRKGLQKKASSTTNSQLHPPDRLGSRDEI
jgi:hypothetical protein